MAFLLVEMQNQSCRENITFWATIWEWPAIAHLIEDSGVIASSVRGEALYREGKARLTRLESRKIATFIRGMLSFDSRERFEVGDEGTPSTVCQGIVAAFLGSAGDPTYVEPGGELVSRSNASSQASPAECVTRGGLQKFVEFCELVECGFFIT